MQGGGDAYPKLIALQAVLRLIYILLLYCVAFVQMKAQGEKFDFVFNEAERQKLAGHTDAALDLFDYCLKLNPESGAAMYELAEIYSGMRNDTVAISLLKRACELYPDNYWYHDNLVMLYFRNRRNDEALVAVEGMAKRFPEKTEVLMMLLDLYGQKRDYAKLIEVLDKVEVKEGKSEQLSMEKFRIFLQMNDEKRAFQEMTDLAHEYPNDLRYQVIIGDLYLDGGKTEEALKQYKMVEEKDSSNITMLLSLTNFYQSQGPDSLYRQYVTRLVAHPSLDVQTRAGVLSRMVYSNLTGGEGSMSDDLLESLFDEVLKQPQESTEVLELKTRWMVTKERPNDEVKMLLYQILDIDPENDMARQQLLHYAIEENDIQGIVDVCRPAVEYKADDPLYYYYLGVGYMQLEEHEEALDAFKQATEHCTEGDENKVNILANSYSLLGEIYHKMGQDEKAFAAYDSCLIYKPNDAMTLNNYAYYLSLNKKDLKRAEEMSRKSNELSPDNSTYLDTYAWVLYQLKRYDEAKEVMDKVVQLIDPEELAEDSDVREHIYMINKKVNK